jgi:NAD+ kinase
LFTKPDPKVIGKADDFEKWLRAHHLEVLRQQSRPPGRPVEADQPWEAPPGLDCVFVLGGDGTFLSAARWVGQRDIPVIGIKFGEVGFLAEIAAEQLYAAAEHVIKREFTITRRMRLDITVIREDKTIARESVLNDVVINKGALARLASIDTHVDDQFLTTFRADGLIVASPTGSTAYSLAAGGPVIHPEVPGIILTPICPFTLTNRPLIVPDGARIKIRLQNQSSDNMLTFDGQLGLGISDRDTILVQKGGHPLSLITLPGHNYFDILKAKLSWSGGRA